MLISEAYSLLKEQSTVNLLNKKFRLWKVELRAESGRVTSHFFNRGTEVILSNSNEELDVVLINCMLQNDQWEVVNSKESES